MLFSFLLVSFFPAFHCARLALCMCACMYQKIGEKKIVHEDVFFSSRIKRLSFEETQTRQIGKHLCAGLVSCSNTLCELSVLIMYRSLIFDDFIKQRVSIPLLPTKEVIRNLIYLPLFKIGSSQWRNNSLYDRP